MEILTKSEARDMLFGAWWWKDNLDLVEALVDLKEYQSEVDREIAIENAISDKIIDVILAEPVEAINEMLRKKKICGVRIIENYTD